MSLKRRGRVVGLLLTAFAVILFLNSGLLSKLMYPVKFTDHIDRYATEYGVNPYFVASIIRVESNFKTGSVSKKGAVGLMQIMPDTAEWIMERQQFSHLSLQQLDNVPDNIHMGIWYLNSLMNQFSGNLTAAAAAYNAGPGNVSRWLSSGQWDGTLQDSDRIPFGETRHYVVKVHYYYEKYAKIYRNGW